MRTAVANQLAHIRTNARLRAMTDELRVAWSRTDNKVLIGWGVDSGKAFGTSVGRRAGNVLRLLGALSAATAHEAEGAAKAYSRDELGAHLKSRSKQAYQTSESFVLDSSAALSKKFDDLKGNPQDIGPQLLMMVVTSLVVSGGPDGDGGAPDLDLMMGIDAHRSIFTHSILMGAALETGLLSLLNLTRLVHGNLPKRRDLLWDQIAQHSYSILHAANQGVSIGMAYHLFVDGLAQPAAYHDLPVSMPMEAHQAILVANATAEALDVEQKPSARPKRRTEGRAITQQSEI